MAQLASCSVATTLLSDGALAPTPMEMQKRGGKHEQRAAFLWKKNGKKLWKKTETTMEHK